MMRFFYSFASTFSFLSNPGAMELPGRFLTDRAEYKYNSLFKRLIKQKFPYSYLKTVIFIFLMSNHDITKSHARHPIPTDIKYPYTYGFM